MSRMSEYDLFLKVDDDLEIRWERFIQKSILFSTVCCQIFLCSSEKLSKALLGVQPWAPSALYCFPLTRVPPYRFTFNMKVES